MPSNKSLEQTPRKSRFFGKASVLQHIVAVLLRLGVIFDMEKSSQKIKQSYLQMLSANLRFFYPKLSNIFRG
jgi:hypothetical protein